MSQKSFDKACLNFGFFLDLYMLDLCKNSWFERKSRVCFEERERESESDKKSEVDCWKVKRVSLIVAGRFVLFDWDNITIKIGRKNVVRKSLAQYVGMFAMITVTHQFGKKYVVVREKTQKAIFHSRRRKGKIKGRKMKQKTLTEWNIGWQVPTALSHQVVSPGGC